MAHDAQKASDLKHGSPKAVSKTHGVDNYLSLLVHSGVLNQDDIAGLREKYNSVEDVFDGLLRSGLAGEEPLVRAYATYRNVPFADLKKVDSEVADTLPQRLAEKYQVLPFSLDKRLLKVAVAYPTRLVKGDLSVIDEIEKRSGLKVEVNYTTARAIQKALDAKGGAGDEVPQDELQTALPRADLSQIKIPTLVINKLPQDIAERYKMLVFESAGPKKIKVGLVDPTDSKARDLLDFIKDKNQIEIEQYQVSDADFRRALGFYGAGAVEEPVAATPIVKSPVISVAPSAGTPMANGESGDENNEGLAAIKQEEGDNNLDNFVPEKLATPADLEGLVKTGSVPKIVGGVVKLASIMKASDIHLEAQKESFLVRYRIDGKLQDIIKIPVGFQKSVVARIKILSKLKIDEARIPQDGRFEAIVNGHEVDMRVSTMPAIYGEKIVLRLLDKSSGIFKLDSLGLSKGDYQKIARAIEKPYGVLMVTGPTGSGKSTTLYAAINYLSNPSLNVITLEDPIEYEIPGINQVQVKPQIGFTFAEGLRAVLRQDPNIVMVGEIRDAETANLVTHAALTGHVVLTTLHTNNAAGAMPRLINMGVEPFLISSAVNAIVAQRLVRKICTECRVEVQVPNEVRAEVEKEFGIYKVTQPIKFFKGQGCAKCKDGYKGRTGIYEVLEITDEVEELIIKKSTANQILDIALKQGMTTMRLDGFLKVTSGITTVDEVLQATMLN